MFECLFTAYAVRRHPLEHLHYQVGALLDVLLGIVLVGQDMLEVALGRVIQLVDQVNSVLANLRANALEGIATGKA